MRFLDFGNDLPHPKKVWKHFIQAVRSKLSPERKSKSISSNTTRRRNSLSHYFRNTTRRCHYCQHKQHQFPLYHSTKQRHLAKSTFTTNHVVHVHSGSTDFGAARKSLANHKEDETQRFDYDDDDEDGGHNYQNAPGDEEGVAVSPLHDVVDVRAQEFIEMFYERLRLERQQSVE